MRVRGEKGPNFSQSFLRSENFWLQNRILMAETGPAPMPWFSRQIPNATLRVAFEDARMNRIENVIIEIGELGFSLGDRTGQRLLQVGSDISWIQILSRRGRW